MYKFVKHNDDSTTRRLDCQNETFEIDGRILRGICFLELMEGSINHTHEWVYTIQLTIDDDIAYLSKWVREKHFSKLSKRYRKMVKKYNKKLRKQIVEKYVVGSEKYLDAKEDYQNRLL